MVSEYGQRVAPVGSIGWLAWEQRIPYVFSIDFLSVFAFLTTPNQAITGGCTGDFLVVTH